MLNKDDKKLIFMLDRIYPKMDMVFLQNYLFNDGKDCHQNIQLIGKNL